MTVPPASHSESPSTDSLYELVEQLTDRMQRGEVVDLSQVVAAHPQHAERLQQVMPALEVFADVHDGESIAAHVAAGTRRSRTDELSGMLGDFRLVREIGRGGMGVVYEARQISLDRRVALKVLPFAGVLDARHLQRFTNEARAAAGLHHPNIVPVYAVGCDRGVHYYAMQYIDGQTLAEVIHELRAVASGGRAPIRRKLVPAGGTALDSASLANDIAQDLTNVESQTSKEIRNNDVELAPEASATHPRTNVRGAPKSVGSLGSSTGSSTHRIPDTLTTARARFRTIAEWGIQIAEALDYAHSVGVIHRDIKPANLMLDSQGRVWITDFGLAQIEADAGLTMTGDIVGTLRYMSPEQALGERGLVDQRTDVYSLGLALYELLTLQPAFGDVNRRELLQRISTDDPVPPRRIDASIPVELDTIVQKATEKDAAARYKTARDLADDLRRFLLEQPIKARPATTFDRLRKWSTRNRVFVRACLGFGFLAILLFGGAGVWVDHERQQTRLEQQARAADQKLAAAASEDLRIHSYVTNVKLAERAWNSGDFAEARRRLQDCLPGAGEDDLRSFEWHYLDSVTREAAPIFAGHLGSVYCFRLSPDGRTAASGGPDGARIWDFRTGAQLALVADHNGDVNSVEFSPDGSLLVTGCDDQSAKIWNAKTGELVQTIPHAGNVVACQYTPDGKILATGERECSSPTGELIGKNVVRLWDASTWESLGELRGLESLLHSVAISDNGKLLAAGGEGDFCWWDLETRTRLHRIPQSGKEVAFAHQHPWLLSVSGQSIDFWRTDDGVHEATLKDAAEHPECVAISHNDSAIVAGGSRGQLKIWDLTSDGEYKINQVFRSANGLWSTTFIDDTTLITTERDARTVRRWDRLDGHDRRRIQFTGPHWAEFAFSPDSRLLATATSELSVYDLATLSAVSQLPIADPPALAAAFSLDGKAVAVGHSTGEIVLFDTAAWSKTRVLPRYTAPVGRLDYVSDGTFLAINSHEAFIDLAKNRFAPCPLPDWHPGDWVLFERQNRASITGRGGDATAWKGDRKLRRLQIPPYAAGTAIAPNGLQFAASLMDGTIHIWNLDNDRPEFVFVGDTGIVGHLAYSSDCRTLLGISLRDWSVKFWNVATGRELLTLETGLAQVHKLGLAPDGKTLVVSGMSLGGRPELSVWPIGAMP